MATTRIVDNDVLKLYDWSDPDRLVATLFWGDTVNVVDLPGAGEAIEIPRRVWDDDEERYKPRIDRCRIPARARFRTDRLLKVRFVDVGQGDAAILESPKGHVVLIDGGEEYHLRRYLYTSYSHVLAERPLKCDAIVVTHGDADHFKGLTLAAEAFRAAGSPLITAERVFHNGLVKRTTNRDADAFGATVASDGSTYVTDLVDDVSTVPDERMNRPFQDWKDALVRLKKSNGTMRIRRLSWGDDEAFAFLRDDGIRTQVLGPIVDRVNGKPALKLLRKPGSASLSASHTVNGHSVVLRFTYGNVRILFGADLNEESEERLLERARDDEVSLAAEVFKVPHHGSADFSSRLLEAVRPVVSVVSSGDESSAKEYIHPRAGLIGALGKFSRPTVERPLIYVTEMVAFFERIGRASVTKMEPRGSPPKSLGVLPRVYHKKTPGIVHVRTDGKRVLVATNSGKDDQKEAYAFHVGSKGEIRFDAKADIV
ncbi:MAG: ComEC/Rec2 family competence protein [Methanobacteriota archaeon]